MTKVIRSIAEDEKIQVAFSSTATGEYKAKERQIILPDPREDEHGVIGSHAADALRGVGFHETAHDLYSEITDEYKEFVMSTEYKGQMHGVVNCFEDIRIERKFREDFPGAVKHQARAYQRGAEEIARQMEENPTAIPDMHRDRPAQALMLATMAREFADSSGEHVDQVLFDRVIEEITQGDPKWRDMIDQTLKRIESCESTMDIAKAAYDWMKWMKVKVDSARELDPPPNWNRPGKGEGDGEGEDEGQGQGEGENGGSPGEGKASGMPDEEVDGGDDEGDMPGWGATNEYVKSSFMDANKVNMKRIMEDSLNPRSRAHGSASVADQNELLDLKGGWEHYAVKSSIHNPDHDQYMRLLSENSAAVGAISNKLRRALQARRDRRWRREADFGRLNPRRLLQARRMEPGSFNRRSPSRETNTSVCLLVDCSGSMEGSRYTHAMIATAAMANALHGIDHVEFGIFGFTDQGMRLNEYIYKDYSEGWTYNTQARLGGYVHMSGNADALHVMHQARKLVHRPNQRKVMIVLSDGHPCGFMGFRHDNAHTSLINAVRAAEEMGIGMFGIGIQNREVEHYYPDHAVLHHTSDLSTTVIDAIVQKLGINVNHENVSTRR